MVVRGSREDAVSDRLLPASSRAEDRRDTSAGIGAAVRFAANLPVAGGAGDNMAGAIGPAWLEAGDAFVSLGTSGVYFVANDRFMPARGQGMHTHRLRGAGSIWSHGCVLSAASALTWIAGFSASHRSSDSSPRLRPRIWRLRKFLCSRPIWAASEPLMMTRSPLDAVEPRLRGGAASYRPRRAGGRRLRDCRLP